MNPSSAPASNETVAYGSLLAQSSKLKRADQVNLVRALAGQLGMIAVFPNQLMAGSAGSPAPKGAGKPAKSKGPAQRAPTNPLSGSPEKKAFDTAKKAVAKATKEAGGQKLPPSHPLVLALERAKDQYFRALSSAKGNDSAPASSWAEDVEASASTSQPSAKPKEKSTPPKAEKTSSPKKGKN